MIPEDPVGLGLVASLAHPGGNMTGVNLLSAEVVEKRLELLRELVPAARRLAVLINPADAKTSETTLRDVNEAARKIGLQVQVARARTIGEIDAAFTAFAREPTAPRLRCTARTHSPRCAPQACLRVSGTTPPLSASLIMTSLCSQIFMSAEPSRLPL
jgi:hypothetical protein